jgi:hypothetical protein
MSDNILLLTEDDNYLTAENGDYLIAVVQYLFTSQNGSYEVAGQTANLLKSKVLVVLNGDYSLVGNNANIARVASPEQKYIELRSFTERRRL